MNTNPAEIEKSIIRLIEPVEGASEDATYEFKCPVTGREFEIRRYDNDYHLIENYPCWIWDEEIKRPASFENFVHDLCDQVAPNEFRQHYQQALLDKFNIVDPNEQRYILIRAGRHEGTPIYLSSIKKCAEKISQSLNDNSYYVSRQPRVVTREDEINDARHSVAFWQEMLNASTSVETKGVFKGTFTLLGNQLGKEAKTALLNYFNCPTKELWSEIYNQQISPNTTLWAAWLAHDPNAPRSKPDGGEWPAIPGGEQLREAITESVKSYRKRAEEKLSECQERLSKLLNESQPNLKLVVDNDADDESQSIGMH